MNAASLERDSAPGPGHDPKPMPAGSDAELLAQMIHDIKNPLSAILCYAEMVAEAKEDERREYCARLQANARAVLDLIDGFGLLVALRGHEIDASVEAFDWVRQAMRVAADLHSVAAFRSQRIACDSIGDRLLRGDRGKLTVAIRGLLLEGLRLAAPGDTVQVHISTADAAVVRVAVPAEGDLSGVAPFDPSRPGLELVARIATLHNGTLVFHLERALAVATLSIPFA